MGWFFSELERVVDFWAKCGCFRSDGGGIDLLDALCTQSGCR